MRKIFLALIAPVLLLAATAVPALAANDSAGVSAGNLDSHADATADRGDLGSDGAESAADGHP